MNKTKTSPEAQKSSQNHTVKKVIASRINENGSKEYLLKLICYEDNMMETEENLNFASLIKAFEDEKAAQDREKNGNNQKLEKRRKLRGFEMGWEPEKIIGATNSFGTLMFLIKWVGRDEPELVLGRQANVLCPQMVIDFYEKRAIWHVAPSVDDTIS